MPKIILVAETGADIPQEMTERYRIHIVPMHVSFGNVTRDDGTFPAEEICRYYETTGELPKTSGSVPEDFIKAFDTIHSQNPDAQILYLAYSSVTTVSYQSALIASEGRNYVTSVDTKSVSAGQCAVVVTMARMLEEHPEWDLATAVATAKGLSVASPTSVDYNDSMQGIYRQGRRKYAGVFLVHPRRDTGGYQYRTCGLVRSHGDGTDPDRSVPILCGRNRGVSGYGHRVGVGHSGVSRDHRNIHQAQKY